VTTSKLMNLAPIIFATLVISAFAAMPLKPDDALTGLLDEEPATPNKMKPAGTSLIDAFLDTKSKAGCVDCTGRARASDEEASGMSGKVGMSFCYRHDGADNTTTAADCAGYWGGSVNSPVYGTEYYACELGIKEKTGRYGCLNSPGQCCLDSNGDFTASSTTILATAGSLTPPMQIESATLPDGSVSDYIVVPNDNGNDMTGGSAGSGKAAFTVHAATETTVELQAQVWGETGADNSFWIWFDGASTADKCVNAEAIVSCTSLKYEWHTAQYQPSAGWQWGYIGWGTDQPIRFPLSAGDHTLHVGQREDGSKMHALRITSGDAVFIPPTSASYTAVATWPIAHWGSWPSSAGSQASCVAASATAFTNPVDVSSESHNEGKNTMFIQCCSTSGAGSTRDCGSTEGKSWSEAKSFCEGKSERLCTASELLLTWSKGCYVDGVDSRAWSSDSC
jgi:hypothetical protein